MRVRRNEGSVRGRKWRGGSDIGHINLRNERFNKKINRNYDRHTAEIKQNLERGTAL